MRRPLSLAALLCATTLGAAPALAGGDAWDAVAGLWPHAHVKSIDRFGKKLRVIAPVERNGKVGFIDRVDSQDVHGGTVYGFALHLTDPPFDVAAWATGKKTPAKIHDVAGLIIVSTSVDGRATMITKADGFPVERDIDGKCVGDACDHDPVFLGLVPTAPGSGVVAVVVAPEAWRETLQVLDARPGMFRVVAEGKGPHAIASETGCSGGVEVTRVSRDKAAHGFLAHEKTTCSCAAAADCAALGLQAGTHEVDVPLSRGSPESDAKVFVQGIYARYRPNGDGGVSLVDAGDKLLAPELAKAVADDSAAARKRMEAPLLEFDPFANAQDWSLEGVTVDVDMHGSDTATATVRFKNFGSPTTVLIDLVALAGGWRIHDVRTPGAKGLRAMYGLK